MHASYLEFRLCLRSDIALHLETLLYMLLQSDRVLPPPGETPNFEALAQDAGTSAVSNEWIKIPPGYVTVGMNDPENDDGPARYFGWDNEKPMRKVHVPAFEAKARPLTNEDFARYLCGTNQQSLPASWTLDGSSRGNFAARKGNPQHANTSSVNGHSTSLDKAYLNGKFVRTAYGPVALEHALTWPVSASYDELSGCAKWMNGRIPTVDEVRSIYNFVELGIKEAEKVQAKKISAVNGYVPSINVEEQHSDHEVRRHLLNDGVEETPPSAPTVIGPWGIESSAKAKELFVDLKDCNVGFSHFHPTPVAQLGKQLCGRGEMGGVWEWTSSRLEEHSGFEAMQSYPGYTGPSDNELCSL